MSKIEILLYKFKSQTTMQNEWKVLLAQAITVCTKHSLHLCGHTGAKRWKI